MASPSFIVCQAKSKGEVMAERWYEGVWLGKHVASGEDLVSMEDGLVVRARTTKERPASVKLSMEMLNTVTGLTWKPSSTLCGTQPLGSRTPDGHADESPEIEEASGRVPYRVQDAQSEGETRPRQRAVITPMSAEAGSRRRC